MTQATEPRERRSFSHRTVFVWLGVSLLCAMAVAAWVYFRYVRYERVAALHVPPGTTAALRVDLEKVVLFEPMRAHVLELVNERPTTMPESRLERLRHYTGIELGVDAREIIVATGPAPGDFEIIIGGLFRSETFLPGVERMMTDEGVRLTRSADGTLLVGPRGLAIGQASDRTIVIASSERGARAALATSTAYLALGLSKEGPGGFAISGAALRGWVPAPLRLLSPNLAAVDGVSRVRGDVELGSEVTLTALVELEPGKGADALRNIEGLLGALRAAAQLPASSGPLSAVGTAASRLSAAPAPDGAVELRGTFQRGEIERAGAYLAELLRPALGLR